MLEKLMAIFVGLGCAWCLIFLARAALPNRLRRWAFRPVPAELQRRRPDTAGPLPRSGA